MYGSFFSYERVNAKILRPILVRNVPRKHFDASKIVRAYAKITLEEAMQMAISTKSSTKRLEDIQEFVCELIKSFREDTISSVRSAVAALRPDELPSPVRRPMAAKPKDQRLEEV